MAELKTKPNDSSIEDFLNSISNEQKKKDSFILLDLFSRLSGDTPKMWGSSIIGFGSYHYKYASGREGDWFKAGFSPRKQSLTIYVMGGFKGIEDLMQKLGKYKTGKGCLYINKLTDVDMEVLENLISRSIKNVS